VAPEHISDTSVMVIFSQRHARKALLDYLQSWGIHALGFSTVKDAVQQAQAGTVFNAALIAHDVADVGSGLAEVSATLSKQIPGIKLILLSYAKMQLNDLLNQGFHGLLPYPVRQSSLLDALISVLGRSRVHPTAKSAALIQDAAPSSDACILLVEDNLVNQKLAAMVLKKLGYSNTQIAGNGQLALEAISKDRYDLVLMDCQMPVMDGFEATRAIRLYESKIDRHTPIIAMTANAMQGDRELCEDAGMDDYLTKPIDQKLLRAALEQWLPK
jgi:CheY-like chemotaxis protein